MLRTFLGVFFVVAMCSQATFAQPVAEPGGQPADANLAINNPDEYAWRLFLFMNLQAAPGIAGVADRAKSITQYDPDAPVVWETWALASGSATSQAGSEVYKPNGEKPGEWKDLPRGPASAVAKTFSAPIKSILNSRRMAPNSLILVAPLDPLGQEVRMNEASFGFIRDNDLYFVQGLVGKLTRARTLADPSLIQFPVGAKEIKAVWERVDMSKEAEEKQRFHWRKVGNDLYKLTAFHIITKDLPNWFWSDFVHVHYQTANGATLPSRDSTTRTSPAFPNPPAKGSKEGERKETTNSKWANYRLRGTQVNFVDTRGNPTILGNGEIEQNFPDQSSCMGCHARATIGLDAKNNFTSLSGGEDGNVLPPNPTLFGKNGSIDFLQSDFVWSAPNRAQPKP